MKKAALIILALILSASLASAEDLQLSSMTDEALAELNKQVQQELFIRRSGAKGAILPQGVYYVGQDLPAGRYRVSVDERVYNAQVRMTLKTGNQIASFNWFELGSLTGEYEAIITLNDGEELEIFGATMMIRRFTGLFE